MVLGLWQGELASLDNAVSLGMEARGSPSRPSPATTWAAPTASGSLAMANIMAGEKIRKDQGAGPVALTRVQGTFSRMRVYRNVHLIYCRSQWLPCILFIVSLLACICFLPDPFRWCSWTTPITLLQSLFSFIKMVTGGVVARALYYLSSGITERADSATYKQNTVAAVKTLQSWYNGNTGLWDTTGWWNSGNIFTTLGDFSSVASGDANNLGIAGILSNTFRNAQKSTFSAKKTLSESFMITTTYTKVAGRDLTARGFSGFLNEFYDDEGWWALGLLRAFDVTRDVGYLDMAQHIFEDMKNGTDNTCGGGIWWSKERKYKNAIANELYLSAAAGLANRAPDAGKKAYYLDIARKQWAWFKNSGMINSQRLINDGLNIKPDGSCVNNGANTWTYNQGVVLGGLVELARASPGDASSLLSDATSIASAAIKGLSSNGILHEVCDSEAGGCGADGSQFKGIFMRNLGYLNRAAPQDAFRAFIKANADSIWTNARTGDNKLGLNWAGPPNAGGGPQAGTHSSAMDTLVAAIAVA